MESGLTVGHNDEPVGTYVHTSNDIDVSRARQTIKHVLIGCVVS